MSDALNNSSKSDRLDLMLHMQRMMQIESFKKDPYAITSSGDMSYIRDMSLALIAEIFEMLNEAPWKPWTTNAAPINKDLFMKEMVDVWCFFMNLMLAVDMTPEELYELYTKKIKVNAQRQLDGYDGISTKCPNCRRALEDLILTEVRTLDGTNIEHVLCECGQELPLETVRSFLSD